MKQTQVEENKCNLLPVEIYLDSEKQTKNKQKNTLLPLLLLFFFQTTSLVCYHLLYSTVPCDTEEGEQKLGWVPSSSPLLLHQGLSLQPALPQDQPLGCGPLTGLEEAPAAARGAPLPCPPPLSLLSTELFLTLSPLTSHCHEMFCPFFKKLSQRHHQR